MDLPNESECSDKVTNAQGNQGKSLNTIIGGTSKVDSVYHPNKRSYEGHSLISTSLDNIIANNYSEDCQMEDSEENAPIIFKAASGENAKENPPVFYATESSRKDTVALMVEQATTSIYEQGKTEIINDANKTEIITNDTNKKVHKRRSYNAVDKRTFAAKAKELGVRKASKELGIPRKNLQRWMQQMDELDILVSSEGGRNKKKVREGKGKFPEMEKSLVSYIKDEISKGRQLMKKEIQMKALDLFKLFYPDSQDVFKATWPWLKGLLTKNHVNLQQHISDLNKNEDNDSTSIVNLDSRKTLIEIPMGDTHGMSTTLHLRCHNCNTDLHFMAAITSLNG